jgi:hypothetical protein
MPDSSVKWRASSEVTVGDVKFAVDPSASSSNVPHVFALTKSRPQVDGYVQLRSASGPWRRIVHVGHAIDGSAALVAELFQPAKLTVLSTGADDGAQVENYRKERDLDERIALWPGVDTTDRGAVGAAVTQDHGRESLDLVIDHAGHSYATARTTFEALFPRLRNDGRYIIDGWDRAHYPGSPFQDRTTELAGWPAVTNLLAELMGVLGTGSDIISAINVKHLQVEVVRGAALVDAPMAIEAHYLNRGITFRPML